MTQEEEQMVKSLINSINRLNYQLQNYSTGNIDWETVELIGLSISTNARRSKEKIEVSPPIISTR